MRTLIENARLVLAGRVSGPGWLLAEDGKILALGEGRADCAADHRENAEGAYLTPGLIDMHLHGGNGADFMDATEDAFVRAAQLHLRHGTTSLMPTTMSASMEELMDLIACYRRVRNRSENMPELLGLHLEGPFLAAAQAGAQDPKYLYPPEPEYYMPLLDAGGGDIRRVSAAIELPGALEMGDELRRRGIIAAVAHSDAVYDEAIAAMEHGYTHLTHFYSGMSGLRRIGAYRRLGLIETAYLEDKLTVEIIADGKHLPPELLRLIIKGIGVSRISLITDAMRGAGLPNGSRVRLGSEANGQMAVIEDDVAFMPDHSCFAGSVCTADRCIRTMVNLAGVSLPDAVRMMTLNPAKLLGISHRKGSLKPGLDADLCLFDSSLRIRAVYTGGRKAV